MIKNSIPFNEEDERVFEEISAITGYAVNVVREVFDFMVVNFCQKLAERNAVYVSYVALGERCAEVAVAFKRYKALFIAVRIEYIVSSVCAVAEIINKLGFTLFFKRLNQVEVCAVGVRKNEYTHTYAPLVLNRII